MATVAELLGCAAGLPGDSPRRDAEILLGHCLGESRSWLYTWPEKNVEPEQERYYRRLLRERETGKPVAYLTGSREFWSLNLAVNNATLIPRPETETLVSWALELPLSGEAGVLDLGTGSGAIALALAVERPEWTITAVDSSEEALAVARKNAQSNRLEAVHFLSSGWYSELHAMRFDLVVANPPYIDGRDEHLQRGDVRFEPRRALVAPEGGLADIRHIVSEAHKHMTPGGWLLLEHGFEQGDDVRRLFSAAGFHTIETRLDFGGNERITGGSLPC